MTVQSEGSPLTGKEYYYLHPALTKTLQSFDIGGPPLSTEFYLNFYLSFVGFHFFIFSLPISLISLSRNQFWSFLFLFMSRGISLPKEKAVSPFIPSSASQVFNVITNVPFAIVSNKYTVYTSWANNGASSTVISSWTVPSSSGLLPSQWLSIINEVLVFLLIQRLQFRLKWLSSPHACTPKEKKTLELRVRIALIPMSVIAAPSIGKRESSSLDSEIN